MAETTPAELVVRWWTEVWENGRLDVIPELTTDPFTRHSPAGTVVRSHPELIEDMQQYRRALSGCAVTFESQIETDDRVFSRILTTGVSLETQEPTVVHWLQEHRVEGGRLAETWVLYTFTPGWDTDTPLPRGYPNAAIG